MLRCATSSLALVAAAVAWTSTAPAHADQRRTGPAGVDEEVVELRYVAPPGCPARQVVEAAIRARTPNARLAAPARRIFTITITAADSGFRGTVVVDERSESPHREDQAPRGITEHAPSPGIADKQLAADTCDDLATALALVTALAIDPTAGAALDEPTGPPAAAPRPPAVPAWSHEADVGAMVDMGVGPGAMVAAVIDGRATLRGTIQLELAAILGRDSTAQRGAEARFTWLAARPGVCRRWSRAGVAIGACGHVEVGAVRASGDMIVNRRDLTRLWLAAGAHGNARYPLGSGIFGQLQLGASLPLVRDHYLFAPNVAIHDTPSVTGWVVVGVGVEFP